MRVAPGLNDPAGICSTSCSLRGTDFPPTIWTELSMRISARNQLKGTIVDVVKGATTSHIRIDIGGGVVVTSSITNEAVDELKLAKGNAAIAVIKASDVMVGVE
jgi:molybdopterin-binding protein